MRYVYLVLFFVLCYNNNTEAQVPRKIFVEHFTNTLCPPCASRNPGFYNNLSNQNNVVHLSIHSGTPYTQCLLYQQNASPSDARRFYYGIGGTPALIMNGFSIPLTSNYSQSSIFTPFKSQTSPISIRMEQQKYGNDSIQVRVIVKTEASHSLGTQQLWVGLAEDTVFYTGPNGEGEHYDVYRANLAFTPINIPTVLGDSIVYMYTAFANVNWDFDQIFAFAMVQNTSNKSVTQSESTSPSTSNLTTSIQKVEGQLSGLKLYPNPTKNHLHVVLERHLETRLVLYNSIGAVIKEQAFQGTTELFLQNLPKGIYILKISNEEGMLTKKVVLE